MTFWSSVVRTQGGCCEHRCLIPRGSSIPVELPTSGNGIHRSYQRCQGCQRSTTSKDAMALFVGEPMICIPSADERG
jgi:hypothetical protein